MYGLSIYGGLLYSNCDQMILPPSLSPIPQFLEIVLERFIYSWQRYSVDVQPGAHGPHVLLMQCMSFSVYARHIFAMDTQYSPGKLLEGRGCSDPVCVGGEGRRRGSVCVGKERGGGGGCSVCFCFSVHRNLLQDDAFVDEIRVSIRYSAAVLLRRAKKVFISN